MTSRGALPAVPCVRSEGQDVSAAIRIETSTCDPGLDAELQRRELGASRL